MTTGSTDYRPDRASSGSSNPTSGSRGTESMEAVKDTAKHTYESTKNEVLGLGEELKHQGAELVGAAKERAQGLAEQQVAFGADQVGGVARAANKAADELQETSPQLARYVRDAASYAENFSTSLRERSVGEIMNDVTSYARREPVVFFGIAVAAGFALSRFLKSSAEPVDRGYAGASGSSYGSSYGNTYPRSGVSSGGSNTPVASTHSTPSEFPTGRTTSTNPTGSTGGNYGGSSTTPAAGTTATGSTTSSTRTTFPSGVGSSASAPSTTPKSTGGPYT